MCDQSQAIAILKEVYSACNPVLDHAIKAAYLYGSYARGDYHEGSDIDILLAVDLPQEKLSLFRSRIASITSNLSLIHDVTVSVAVKPFKQFQQHANILPYYKNVLKEGILYAS